MVFVLWIYLVLIFGDYNKYLREYIPELLSCSLVLFTAPFSVHPVHPAVPVPVSCSSSPRHSTETWRRGGNTFAFRAKGFQHLNLDSGTGVYGDTCDLLSEVTFSLRALQSQSSGCRMRNGC